MIFFQQSRKLFFTSLLFLACFVSNAQFQQISLPHIQNYTTKDYNGQPDNFACIEDYRGFMYFGNLWGILEFDGTSWRNIYFPNGSSGISFAKDEKGKIFCGGRGEFGYLEPNNAGIISYHSLSHLIKQKIDFSEVWSTIYLESAVVFCSFEAIFIYKNNEISTIIPKTSFERASLIKDKIFVNEKGRGICFLKGNKLELAAGGNFFADITLSAILPYEQNSLLLAANNHFYSLSQGRISSVWNEHLAEISKVFTAISFRNNGYILATNTNGIVITDLKGNIRYTFNKNNGLISNDILNCYYDSLGNIWVLSRGGISKIELSDCFSYINEYQGVSGIHYASYYYYHNFYLGTSDGLFTSSIQENVNKNFTMVPHTEGNVWALEQIGDELFCGHNEGIFVINPKGVYHVPNTNGVWCFLQPKGSKDIILAGTYHGIIMLEKKFQKWQMKAYVKGFSESSRYLIQDQMEDLWVSHGNKGLFKLRLNHNLDSVLKIKNYGIQEGLGSAFNNTVYKYNNEVIVTNNKGIYKYDFRKEHFGSWTEINSALGSFIAIQRFVYESDSSFWIILNDEKIVHLSKQKDRYKNDITIRKFYKLLAGSFEHIFPFDNNTALISTVEGLAVFDKKQYYSKIDNLKKHYKAYIRNIELTRDSFISLNADNKLSRKELQYRQNSVRFSFSSNNFEDIELTKYQCFLLGFDHEWSPWLSFTQKEYTNLSPGRYKFIIRAINSYNIISKEDYFEFVILPPWYRSNYAYTVYLILFLLLIWGIYSFVIYRFKLQKRRLELKKERELWFLNKKHLEEQIKKENEILKLNNEKLLSEISGLEQKELLLNKDRQLKEEQDKARHEQLQYEHEKHELEISYKNKELSIMAMHIAHKNELITKIREYLNLVTEKNDSLDSKALTSQLFQFIDKDVEHDKEWKEFQEHFEMVHSSFLNKLKVSYPAISPNLLKLSAYLRVKMSNKQIARLMNTTVESVLKSRYRLREKLQLSPEENLDDFIEKF